MCLKELVKTNDYLLDGFASLLFLSDNLDGKRTEPDQLERKIASIMRENWESVGKNMREALNRYGSENRIGNKREQNK